MGDREAKEKILKNLSEDLKKYLTEEDKKPENETDAYWQNILKENPNAQTLRYRIKDFFEDYGFSKRGKDWGNVMVGKMVYFLTRAAEIVHGVPWWDKGLVYVIGKDTPYKVKLFQDGQDLCLNVISTQPEQKPDKSRLPKDLTDIIAGFDFSEEG